MRFPASQRRRYERLSRFPDGLLVVGDALCSFNPAYAQGMTVAALEALALGECLAAGSERLADRFFARASAVVDSAWSVSARGDLRFPEVEGERTPLVRFISWYLGKLHVAAHDDPVVAVAFQRVVNMLASPPSVLRPRIALRVLRSHLRRRSADRPGANAALSRQTAIGQQLSSFRSGDRAPTSPTLSARPGTFPATTIPDGAARPRHRAAEELHHA